MFNIFSTSSSSLPSSIESKESVKPSSQSKSVSDEYSLSNAMDDTIEENWKRRVYLFHDLSNEFASHQCYTDFAESMKQIQVCIDEIQSDINHLSSKKILADLTSQKVLFQDFQQRLQKMYDEGSRQQMTKFKKQFINRMLDSAFQSINYHPYWSFDFSSVCNWYRKEFLAESLDKPLDQVKLPDDLKDILLDKLLHRQHCFLGDCRIM